MKKLLVGDLVYFTNPSRTQTLFGFIIATTDEGFIVREEHGLVLLVLEDEIFSQPDEFEFPPLDNKESEGVE